MREEYFQIFETEYPKKIPAFLASFGKDLKGWTHTTTTPHGSNRHIHHVIARFGSEYGDIEDDMYVPFD